MAKQSGGTRSRSVAPGSVGSIAYKTAQSSLEAKASAKIAQVLDDMHNGVKWQRPPFTVGFIDKEIETYCMTHGIQYSSKYLYFITERIQHSQRDSKAGTLVYADDADLINFPTKRHSMEIFYDKKKNNFIYTDRVNKFVVEMNYELKIKRQPTKKVNFITVDKLTNPNVFDQHRETYKKVK